MVFSLSTTAQNAQAPPRYEPETDSPSITISVESTCSSVPDSPQAVAAEIHHKITLFAESQKENLDPRHRGPGLATPGIVTKKGSTKGSNKHTK